MYEELGRLLEGRASDELTTAIMSLDATLVKAGFKMHREELDLLVGIESTVDGNAILQSVVEILRIAAERLLAPMEIGVTEDIPLDMLTGLVTTVAFYEPSDNDDEIDAVIKLSLSSDETLCMVLNIVTEFSFEDYFPYITAVSDNLIKKIESLIFEAGEYKISPVTDLDSETTARIALVRKNMITEFSSKLSDEGIPDGIGMENLYNTYSSHLLTQSMEGAVKGLVYMAMISNLSTESVGDEAAFFIEDLYPSIEDNQKATRILRNELASFESLINKGE
jgi:hypothetical protein